MEETDVCIIGSGISGLSAAIYTGRSGHETTIIRGDEPGGQLTLTTEVANYPGFPDPVDGTELVNRMTEQAESFGATLENGVVEDMDTNGEQFTITLTNGDVVVADAVIVASGASARTLGVPGEEDLMGYGVSTCATCDGAFFQGEDMVVVGGGDSAFEEAKFLTKFADTVHLLHRRESFSAEEYLIDEVVTNHVQNGDIEIHQNTELLSIDGTREDGINGATIATNPMGHPTKRLEKDSTEVRDIEVGAVFIAIGHEPNTGFLEDTPVELDSDGYIRAAESNGNRETATNVDGVFAAGDVTDSRYQQAATSAGSGVKAAIDTDEYLSN